MTQHLLLPPEEDELAVSHAHRLAKVNDLPESNLPGTLRAMLPDTVKRLDRNLPLACALGILGGLQPGEYLQRHTAIPILRFATWPSDIAPHSQTSTEVTRSFAMKVPRAGGLICPDCVEAQVRKVGFSWYRRSHHIFGVDWCSDHGTPLLAISDVKPLSKLPAHWLRSGKLKPLPNCKGRLENAPDFVRRLVAVSARAYGLTEPVSALLLKCLCSLRANSIGLRLSYSENKPTLSDLVLQQAPLAWVKTHLDRLETKTPGDFFREVDDLLIAHTHATAEAALLGLAALFDDPIEKLDQLSRHDPLAFQ